jgi:phosphoglycolate phosphatase
LVTIRCGNCLFEGIEAIIFDKDGTLEDSHAYLRELTLRRTKLIDAQIPGIGEPLSQAFGLQNQQLDPTGLMAVGSRAENEIAAAAYIAETGRPWFESLAIARACFEEADRYCRPDAQTSPIFAGSQTVIKNLSEAGLKLAILSAAGSPSIERFVQTHQLAEQITVRLGADRGFGKPDPRFFQQACDQLAVTARVTLMVGDSQGDITMAKAAGAAAVIAIAWGHRPHPFLDQADVLISHLEQIQVV